MKTTVALITSTLIAAALCLCGWKWGHPSHGYSSHVAETTGWTWDSAAPAPELPDGWTWDLTGS